MFAFLFFLEVFRAPLRELSVNTKIKINSQIVSSEGSALDFFEKFVAVVVKIETRQYEKAATYIIELDR